MYQITPFNLKMTTPPLSCSEGCFEVYEFPFFEGLFTPSVSLDALEGTR